MTFLIQQTSDRLAVRYKRKIKRNPTKGSNAGSSSLTSTTNDSNRAPHFSPTHSSLLSPNIFNAVQGISRNSMPPTATRNPSSVAPTTKKTTPSLESLLSSGSSVTPNGPSQYNSTPLEPYNAANMNPTKPANATKNTTPKNAANKGAEPARRGPAPGTTGGKRFVLRRKAE